MAIWGVSDPIPIALVGQTVGAADVACPAGVETNVISFGGVTALSPGGYYPIIDLALAIVLGATPPTALVVAAKVGAGSDFDSFATAIGLLVALATLGVSPTLVGANSTVNYYPGVSTINITVLPTGQPVTCKFVGSRATLSLIRGLDL